MRNWIVLAALTLAACNGTDSAKTTDTDIPTDNVPTESDSDDATETDSEDTTSSDTEVEGCEAEVASIDPRDDAINVAIDASIEVTFTEAVTAEDYSIAIDGVSGTSELASDGLTATFTPDADLDNETSYEVDVTVCDDSDSYTFTTSAPPLDESELIGRVYVLDMADVTWEKPALISLFASDLTFEFLLLEVTAYDEDTAELGFVGAIGETAGGSPTQAQCYPVLDFEGVDFTSNPNFVLGPEDLIFPVDGYDDLTMEGFTFKGAFSSDGESLESIEIEALIDTEPLDDLAIKKLGMTACALSSAFGEDCVACADGDETCLETLVTADEAAHVESVDIDESYDPAADSDC